ncbi:MAG: hypothetical protein Q9224_002735, partial [Gallowayella concinna]
MGCRPSRPSTSASRRLSRTDDRSSTSTPTPIAPNAKAQKRLAKEAAVRAELERQDKLLSGGRTVGIAANPQYGGGGKGKSAAEPEASRAQAQAPIPPPPLIIKADELDATGTDVSTPVPDVSTPITPALQAPPFYPTQSSQQTLTASPRPVQARPILRREGSTPAPPSQPPPPTPEQQQQQQQQAPSEEAGQLPTDSLSLQQLRRLVTEFPKLEPQAYAYEHADTRSFVEEVEEWFPYSEDEKYLLLRGKEVFERTWKRWDSRDGAKWIDANEESRRLFVRNVVDDCHLQEKESEAVECLSYLALGCWGDTAGLEEKTGIDKAETDSKRDHWGRIPPSQSPQTTLQIKWMREGGETLAACGAFQDDQRETDVERMSEAQLGSTIMNRYIVLNQTLTAMYLMIETARWGSADTKSTLREAISMQHITDKVARCTVATLHKGMIDSYKSCSHANVAEKLLLLYWKTILLMFGDSEDLQHSKEVLRPDTDTTKNEHDEGFITATPLDYHLFRQEITSKYPAYNPPPPLLPIELENTTILPPLPNHPSRRTSQENLHFANSPAVNGAPGSIFYQPVHIATPAPSPPPSPAGPGGKGGKKQNYQTNQNFPFLYPPLDETSNIVGGKGDADMQDQHVGKHWEGSDVPASILEAGQLFASRMRMSRSIRQLWDVREQYIRHERGWNEHPKDDASAASDESVIEEDDESAEGESRSAAINAPLHTSKEKYLHETSDEDVQRRLDAIESFYRNSLPHLQSVILVLWKIIFTNVSYLVSQANGQNGLAVPNGISFPDDNHENEPAKKKMTPLNPNSITQENGHPTESENELDPVMEELNAIRLREVSTKAISAILLTLLKWFKLSHILKFEYMTQLLLDANYVPLTLKLFAHQDVDRAVDQKNDRDDL